MKLVIQNNNSLKIILLFFIAITLLNYIFFTKLYNIKENKKNEENHKIEIKENLKVNNSINNNNNLMGKNNINYLPKFNNLNNSLSKIITFNQEGWFPSCVNSSFQLNLTMQHIFSFDFILSEIRNKMKYTSYNFHLKVFFPAFTWWKEKLHFFARVLQMDSPEGKEKSYIWYQQFDENFNPINDGNFIGFLTLTAHYLGGQEDSRVFIFKDNLYLIFNMRTEDPYARKIYVYDVIHGNLFEPIVENFTLKGTQKNWVPLVYENQLYFVYSFEPLIIFKCNFPNSLKCNIFFSSVNLDLFINNTIPISMLRGGTPFLYYKDSYFISYAHSRWWLSETKIFYRPLMVILRINPTYIAYVGDILRFPYSYENIPILDKTEIIYPVGIQWEEGLDSLLLGISLNDTMAFSVRIGGLKSFLDKLIEQDSPCTIKNGEIEEFILKKEYFKN